jgi:periplasmic divalent cation tolerance protein
MKKLNIFYTTCSDLTLAKKLTKKLLIDGFANCINMIKNVESFYIDKNKMNSTNEIVLIIKTTKSKINIEKYLDSNHPYDIPFIGKIHIESVNKKYMQWIDKNM